MLDYTVINITNAQKTLYLSQIMMTDHTRRFLKRTDYLDTNYLDTVELADIVYRQMYVIKPLAVNVAFGSVQLK